MMERLNRRKAIAGIFGLIGSMVLPVSAAGGAAKQTNYRARDQEWPREYDYGRGMGLPIGNDPIGASPPSRRGRNIKEDNSKKTRYS